MYVLTRANEPNGTRRFGEDTTASEDGSLTRRVEVMVCSPHPRSLKIHP